MLLDCNKSLQSVFGLQLQRLAADGHTTIADCPHFHGIAGATNVREFEQPLWRRQDVFFWPETNGNIVTKRLLESVSRRESFA